MEIPEKNKKMILSKAYYPKDVEIGNLLKRLMVRTTEGKISWEKIEHKGVDEYNTTFTWETTYKSAKIIVSYDYISIEGDDWHSSMTSSNDSNCYIQNFVKFIDSYLYDRRTNTLFAKEEFENYFRKI